MEKELTAQGQINITTILQQARERLPQKDHLYYYLQLEHAIVENHIYTKESLRKVVKDSFNIAWLPPPLKALFETSRAEQLIFLEIILKSAIKHLSKQDQAALQKMVNEKTRTTPLEGIVVGKGNSDMEIVEQRLFSDEKQFEQATILIHDLLKILSAQDKGIIKAAFAEVKKKYITLPLFTDVIHAMPAGILDDERRAILSPEAAAAAKVVSTAKELLQGKEMQQEMHPFTKKIEEANALPIEEQTQAFFTIYREIEHNIVQNNKMPLENLREQIKTRTNIKELPESFQLLFLDNILQLITLAEDFNNDFISRTQLSDTSNIPTTKKSLMEKIPILAVDKEGNFLPQTILDNLPEKNRERKLSEALTEYLAFFHQRGSELLDPKKVHHALKESYTHLQQRYGPLAAKLFPLLPGDVLTKEERHQLLRTSYAAFAEGLLREEELKEELTPLYKELNKKRQSAKEDEVILQKHFSEFFEAVNEKMEQKLGHEGTERIFQQSYDRIKGEYGAYPIFNDILKAVPRGILEIERFNILSKEELEKVSKALKRTEQVKSTFTNIAAHELQTPLVPIIGYAQLLIDKKLPPQKVKEYAEVIHQNARREKDLVRDLLDISKLEAGEMKFEMEDVNITSILHQAVTDLSLEAQQKNIKLKCTLQKSLPPVHGDTQRLTQVITNLISNALKFTEKGSITLTAKRGTDTIQVSVTDTGMGIKKEDIPKLFTKFVQTQDYTTRKTRGTGLGLAICKEIVQAHKGKLWVESKGVGKGATFRFTLPVAAGRGAAVGEAETRIVLGKEITAKEAEKELEKELEKVAGQLARHH
jgi:signal transduction histidine kinase